jgi:hypothetical protein
VRRFAAGSSSIYRPGKACAATRPYSTGTVHVNDINSEEPDRIEEAYGGEIHRQLVDLENRHDPENLLHHNQNNAPSVRSAG